MSDLKSSDFEVGETVEVDGSPAFVKKVYPLGGWVNLQSGGICSDFYEGTNAWNSIKKLTPTQKAEWVSNRAKLPPLATEVHPLELENEQLKKVIAEMTKALCLAVRT